MSEIEGEPGKPELSEVEKEAIKTRRYLDFAILASPLDMREKVELIANDEMQAERAKELAVLVEGFLQGLRQPVVEHGLNNLQFEIIKYLYGLDPSADPMKIKQVARKLNISPEKVRRTNESTLQRVRSLMGKNKRAILFIIIDH